MRLTFLFVGSMIAGAVLLGALAPAVYADTPKPEVLPFDPGTEKESKKYGLSAFSTGVAQLQLGQRDPITVTILIINVLLTLLGMGFLIMVLYAGVIWVWARGNEEAIDKSKTILRRALFGLIIVLSAWGIANLVFLFISNLTLDGNL